MVPLPESKLDNIIPLVKERFDELGELRPKLGPDPFHHALKAGYAQRVMDCYVNDIESPTHIVVLMRVTDFWGCDPFVNVHGVFISKPMRGHREHTDAMVDCILKYANFHGIKRVVASAKCYDNGLPITKLWERSGFRKSSISYQLDLP